jgi:hypothetical protein
VLGIGPRSSCNGWFLKLNIFASIMLVYLLLIMYLIMWVTSKLICHCVILKLGAKINYIFRQRELPLLNKVSLTPLHKMSPCYTSCHPAIQNVTPLYKMSPCYTRCHLPRYTRCQLPLYTRCHPTT